MARFEPFRLSDDDRTDLVKGVSCALLLERHGYLLDKPESTRNALKYRAGKGETIIVNHEGRGWWDTGSDEKGDVFSLIQRLTPGLKFRDACRELGQLVGIEPKGAEYVRERQAKTPDVAPAERWQARKELKSGTKVWAYLTEERCLPEWVLRRAIMTGCIRDGYHAAWFCHRDAAGTICGAELRGPDTKGICLSGTVKTLFRFQPGLGRTVRRLVVSESAIDALSYAALDSERTRETLYCSTAGGMGPETVEALTAELAEMAKDPAAVLVAATDNDDAGNRYAARLAELGREAGARVIRRIPHGGCKDFNDALKTVVAAARAA
ncbi:MULTISPECIES: DUF3991 and toprim domain-containing protein [unclassified Gluconobacter]|uniref:DUF3991 and toprim domain-containing protein n=1 Tax=unclassified Gluconobacter TaxID=2644261 RepID=UPI0002E43754|nr:MULTISPECIES: DUF3991 and toprim domain-containing protein [unclassified Gluconobacter]GAP25449.1 hypothetical protein GLF_2331 [Gluconobacter frateurii NBRC 101659]